MTAAVFFTLLLRSFVTSLITFALNFVALLVDFGIKIYLRRRRRSEDSLLLGSDPIPSTRQSIVRCLRTSSLVALCLFWCMLGSCFRRAFTDASGFTISQMWWHSLVSVIDVLILLAANRWLAGQTLSSLGFPLLSKWRAWIPSRRWMLRLLIATVIAAGTHLITPGLLVASGCSQGFQGIDYSHNSVYETQGVGGLIYFFLLQEICFWINAVDEESNWRGFSVSLYKSEDHSPVVMYLFSGWVYAMVHTLNGFQVGASAGQLALMVAQITCEGMAWMYLYRTTHDLPGNWALHCIDDLFSIWFGPRVLAGYALPAGQIAPYDLNGCPGKPVLSGGPFGPGASILYSVQTLYTVILIAAARWMCWKKVRKSEVEHKPING